MWLLPDVAHVLRSEAAVLERPGACALQNPTGGARSAGRHVYVAVTHTCVLQMPGNWMSAVAGVLTRVSAIELLVCCVWLVLDARA